MYGNRNNMKTPMGSGGSRENAGFVTGSSDNRGMQSSRPVEGGPRAHSDITDYHSAVNSGLKSAIGSSSGSNNFNLDSKRIDQGVVQKQDSQEYYQYQQQRQVCYFAKCFYLFEISFKF